MKKLVFATMAIIVMLALASCDDGGSDTPKPTVTSVAVTGGSTSVAQGQTSSAFSAAVTGKNNPAQTVTWSLVGETNDTAIADTVATINSTAKTVTVKAAAPVGTKFRVKATSTVDKTKSGYSAVISVTAAGNTPSVTSVTVTGGSTQLEPGQTSNAFTATVVVQNGAAQTVDWSLVGETNDTAIADTVATFDSAARTVMVKAAAPVDTKFRVKATSTVDNTKFGHSAVITVVAAGTAPTVESVTVTYDSATTTVRQGETSAAFSVDVDGTHDPAQTVTWSLVSGDTGDTELAAGTATFDDEDLTVTVDMAAVVGTRFRVKATSTVDTTKSGYSPVITVTAHRVLEEIVIRTPPNANITTIRQHVGTIPATADDWTGIRVFAKYDNNTEEELIGDDGKPLFTVDASAVNIDTVGTYKVKVIYEDEKVEFDVIVKALTGITLVSTGVTTDYYQFYDSALRGLDTLSVWAQHTDFDNDYLLDSEGNEAYTVVTTAVNFNTAGTPNVVVTYKTQTANLPVTVHALSSIDVDIDTEAGSAFPTNKLDLIANAVINAVYANAHRLLINELLTADDITVSTPTSSPSGDTYTITVTWHLLSDTFTFLVTSEEILSSITISGTHKTTYYQYFDTAFDPTGVIVTAHYSQDTPDAVVTVDATYDYNDDIFTTPGSHDIIVSYRDSTVSPVPTDRTAHITITIVAATGLEIELTNPEFNSNPNAAQALAAIKTANAVYADQVKKDIKVLLIADMIQIDTDRKEIIISWHGVTPALVPYFLTGNLNLIITVKDFYDVDILEVNLGAISILSANPPKVVLSGTSDYTSIKWVLNGTDTGMTAREYQIVLGASAKIGRNVLSVEVVLDGVTYRKNIVYTVIL